MVKNDQKILNDRFNNAKELLTEISEYLAKTENYNSQESTVSFRDVLRKSSNDFEKQQINRVLRLVIAGNIKVGKSSFLNALLFDGKNILPQAATPMTAALTHISYADSPSAEVYYHNAADWQAIKEEHDRYLEKVEQIYNQKLNQSKRNKKTVYSTQELPSREKIMKELNTLDDMRILTSCYELYESVEENNQTLKSDCIRQEKVILHADSTEQLATMLNDYVGAHGKYTSYVKYVEIKLPLKEIKGIEITDTPGINDPIRSRDYITRDYISKCDLVLFLSRGAQFMGETDISFIKDYIPSDAQNKTYIIGTQSDLLMRQEPVVPGQKMIYSNQLKHRWSKLSSHASRTLAQQGITIPSTHFILVSSWLYTIAIKLQNESALSEQEQKDLEILTNSFTGFNPNDAKFLNMISFIGYIKGNVLPQIQQDKDIIIAESANNVVNNMLSNAIEALGKINDDTNRRLQELRESNLSDLERKEKNLSKTLNGIRTEIASCFSEHAISVEQKITKLASDIKASQHEFTSMETKTTAQYKRYTESYGFLGMWKRGHRETYYIETGSVSSAISQIQQYAAASDQLIAENYLQYLGIRSLKSALQSTITKKLSDDENCDLSYEELLPAISAELSKLGEINHSIDSRKYADALITEFPNADREISADKLRKSMIIQMINVGNEVQEILSKYQQRDCNELKRLSARFIDNLEKRILADIEQIKAMMNNKRNSIETLEAHKKQLSEYMDKLDALY